MNKEVLISKATQITPPSPLTSNKLKESAETMAQELTLVMAEKKNLESLIGEGNYLMMVNNHKNHFDYICSLTSLYDPLSFVETVLWVFRTYIGRGFSPAYWQEMLQEAKIILRSHLPDEQYKEAIAIYNLLHDNLTEFIILSESTPSFYETLGNINEGITPESLTDEGA